MKLKPILIALMALMLVACADFENMIVYKDETKQSASNCKDRYLDKEWGANVEVSSDCSHVTEFFVIEDNKLVIGKRWKYFEGGKSSQIVRPTGFWMPEGYGPFGYEGSTFVDYNIINAPWPRNDTDMTYCVRECRMTIKLRPRGPNKTSVEIRYINEGGKAMPFVEDMRVALRYYYHTRPDGVPYDSLEE